jgi:hypothetical protein
MRLAYRQTAKQKDANVCIGVNRIHRLQCMHATIQALQFNLHRYPVDQATIYQSLKGLGDNSNHSEYIDFLSDHLLRIDRRFAPTEPQVDDMFYVAILILVFGMPSQHCAPYCTIETDPHKQLHRNAHAHCSVAATKHSPSISARLPGYTIRHYQYLRDKYPTLFTVAISATGITASTVATAATPVNALAELPAATITIPTEIDQFFINTWSLLCNYFSSTSAPTSIHNANLMPEINRFAKYAKYHAPHTHTHTQQHR